MARYTREYTNKMLELMDEGAIESKILAEQLLSWLSEDDAKEFWYAYNYNEAFEEEEDE